MICLKLFLVFVKIGLFTFGGGYGMIPLIQQEVTARGWLDAERLLDYIGVCESTPGPIAVNMATFIGASQAGLLGSLCATVGVVLPSFVIILLIAAVMKQFSQNRYVRAALSGIKPVVSGMIAATGAYIALNCVFTRFDINAGMALDLRRIAVFAVLLVACVIWRKWKRKPIPGTVLIVLAALLGVFADI